MVCRGEVGEHSTTGHTKGRPATGRRARCRRQARFSESGAVLIEFALVFLLFMVLVMGMVDFGLAINSKTQISNGGREAARIGTLGRSPDEMEDRVRETTSNLDQDKLTVDSVCEQPDGTLCSGDFDPGDVRNGDPGDSVIVTVNYTYGVITPIPRMIGLGSDIDLESVTEMRIE